MRLASDHLRFACDRAIEKEIPARHRLLLEPVRDAPVDEEAAFVLKGGLETAVPRAEVVNLSPALAKLPLPSRHIGIDEEIRGGSQQGGSGTNDKNAAPRGIGGNFPCELAGFQRVEKIGHLKGGIEVAENRVITSQKRPHHGINLRLGFERLLRVDREDRLKSRRQPCEHFFNMNSRVAFDGHKKVSSTGFLANCGGDRFPTAPARGGVRGRHGDTRKLVVIRGTEAEGFKMAHDLRLFWKYGTNGRRNEISR